MSAILPYFFLAAVIIPLALVTAAPLFHLDVKVWGIHFMTGTRPYGWPQGLSSHPDSLSGENQYCLVIGKWYWYVRKLRRRPNQTTAHNAGRPSQFRFAVHGLWSGVCEFHRWREATIGSILKGCESLSPGLARLAPTLGDPPEHKSPLP